MERTKHSKSNPDEEVYLPKSLIQKFKKHKNYVDVLALYVLYYERAIVQKTNQPYAIESYCMSILGIGKQKFRAAKRVLQHMKIIEQMQERSSTTKFGKPYIKLNTYQKSDRRTQNSLPLINKVDDDTIESTVAAETRINSVDGYFPIDPKRPTNAYKEKNNKENTHTRSGLRPPRVSTEELPKVCPHGHTFGEWYNHYPECEGCIIFDPCSLGV